MIDGKTVVIDLDGTLCDCNHRVHLAKASQWDEFHSQLPRDKPFSDVLWLIGALIDRQDVGIIALTGRNDDYQPATLAWLVANGIMVDTLIMRPSRDYTPDHILKPQLLQEHFGSREKMLESVAFVLEDRDKVVEAWRNIGISCWQVRNGTY